MSKTIFTKTDAYIQDLLDTPELKDYRKSLEDFKNDAEAKKVFDNFQEAQQTLAVFREGGFDGIEQQQQKVRHLREKVENNQKIQSLIKNQQKLQTLVGDLAGSISKGINFPFVQPQRGGCCG